MSRRVFMRPSGDREGGFSLPSIKKEKIEMKKLASLRGVSHAFYCLLIRLAVPPP